jgi:hypothetical protein
MYAQHASQMHRMEATLESQESITRELSVAAELLRSWSHRSGKKRAAMTPRRFPGADDSDSDADPLDSQESSARAKFISRVGSLCKAGSCAVI